MTTDVSGVMRPVATANGLPNDHYVDERIFLEERDAVLYNNWSGIAVAADVPEKGEFGAALGAARLAIVGATGIQPEAIMTPPKIAKTICPRADLRADYDAAYDRVWTSLYNMVLC